MKTLKTLLIIITICFSTNTEAQIWKKLAKKAEKAAEKTLEKKVEEKTSRETDKAFDSTFNNSKKNNKKTKSKKRGAFGMSSATPEDTYKFSHKYILRFDNGKKPFELSYYLNTKNSFLGFEIPNEKDKTFTVMDFDKEVMFMFVDDDGLKTRMSMKLKLYDLSVDLMEEYNYVVKATGKTKSILGYLCKEYNITGKDMYGTAWIAEGAGISFSDTFFRAKQRKGVNQYWMSMVNGLPMEMTMTDTSKRKPKTMTTTCIYLKAESFSIDTSSYKKLM